MKNLPFTTNKLLITKLLDRKSTRLNSSHDQISYAVFCLKKKIIAENVFDDGVPYERDLFVLHRAVLHDFGSPQLVAPVDNRDLSGELGEERGFLHRTVAATDDNQFLSLEEKSIAGRTG